MPSAKTLPAWQLLTKLKREMDSTSMRKQFAADPSRFDRFSAHLDDLLFDYSKNRMDESVIGALLELAKQARLKQRTEAMFTGEAINSTENRAALHTALRNRSGRPVEVDGQNVMPEINRVLIQMANFSERIRSGAWTGYTGQRITDVVNIGIGGSDLGPRMVCRALRPYASRTLHLHFVANVDGADISGVLETLNPATTLFLVASKTFSTIETMTNAHTARDWFLAAAGDTAHIEKHFAAMSTNREAVQAFGINPANMFEFWDWVGGRYSLWSAIGLSIALGVGMDNFEALLEGAHAADEHFRNAPLEQNIPVLMAMLGIWYNNFYGARSHAVLAYDQNLDYFADYLQQADMESNGKRVDHDGQAVEIDTGPVIWGQPGTNGQHAFYQLLHQGTQFVPCDFLAAARSHEKLDRHQEILIANFLAQPEALMRGRTPEEARQELATSGIGAAELDRLAGAKSFPGNRPSNSFLYRQLDPATLGKLIALYEHKIFVQGVIWNVNSFDQMGVELGKQLATALLPAQESGQAGAHDSSTAGLLRHYQQLR